MSSSAIARVFSAVLLNWLPLGTSIRLKCEARLREQEREWRERQAAQLESLKQRIQAEEEFATGRYTDLPHIRLAEFLAAPRDARVEER
jgi:hypothetical protein